MMMTEKEAADRREYHELVDAVAASLAPGELWCVYHPDGPLEETASSDFTRPVRVVCQALDADWDDLREAGFYLGKITKP